MSEGENDYLTQEYVQGYYDGRDPECPEPSGNRSEAYRHSFAVGRAELAGRPIPYDVSMKRCAEIEAREGMLD